MLQTHFWGDFTGVNSNCADILIREGFVSSTLASTSCDRQGLAQGQGDRRSVTREPGHTSDVNYITEAHFQSMEVHPLVNESRTGPTGGPRTHPRTRSDTFGHFGHRHASNTGHTGHMSSDIFRTLGHMSSDTPDICPRTRPDTSGHTGHSGQPGLCARQPTRVTRRERRERESAKRKIEKSKKKSVE